jgi:tetratricopeptide (TPR) repeat protein
MNVRSWVLIAAAAVAALAAWPAFVSGHWSDPTTAASAGAPDPSWTPAPVTPDYLTRDAVVSFYEADARRDPDDQLIAQMLAGQYMQRYRERADVGDLLRARREAERSLAIQPRFNYQADLEMSSILLAFHDMRGALGYAREAERIVPSSDDARSTVANLDMETGDYAGALALLRHPPASDNPVWDISLARYDELTGRLAAARTLISGVARASDEVVSMPAESRAWAHWREGELAFEAGDLPAAESHYDESLAIFPHYWHGENGLAKVYWAQRRWPQAAAAAQLAVQIYPLPETLGYEYDAQRGMGDAAGAAQTFDLIRAIERIGNAQGMNDRLIAMFYADHGAAPDDAIAIARRDLLRRDDVYAEDTIAWALASAGRWSEARMHAERAVRLGTEDARLQYHAGVIALHCGYRDEARRRLQLALAFNPAFNPEQAPEAKTMLAALQPARALGTSISVGPTGN